MDGKPKYRKDPVKAPKAVLSSQTIAEQTEAFLQAGGEIQYIDRGVTGYQQPTGRRQLTLNPGQEQVNKKGPANADPSA